MDNRVAPEPRLQFVAAGDSRTGGSDHAHTGTLDVGESVLTCSAPTDEGLRAGVIAVAAVIAAQIENPVLLRVTDATGATPTRDLAVRPDGVVEVPGAEGNITGDEDLEPYTGPCRVCGEEQVVIAASCSACGCVDPLRVAAHGEVSQDVLAALPEEVLEDEQPNEQYVGYRSEGTEEAPQSYEDVPTWPLILVMLMEHGAANVRIDSEHWSLRAASLAAVRAQAYEHIRQHGSVPLGRAVRADIVDPTTGPFQVIVGPDGTVHHAPEGAATTSTRADDDATVPVVLASTSGKVAVPRQRAGAKRARRGNQLLVIGSTSALAALVLTALALPQSIPPLTTVLGMGTEPTGASTSTAAPTSAATASAPAQGGDKPAQGASKASGAAPGSPTSRSTTAPSSAPSGDATGAPESEAPESTAGPGPSAPATDGDAPSTNIAPETAAPSSTSSPATSGGSITVASGDTLSDIAAQTGVSVDRLAAANDLPSADQIKAGQRLVVSGPAVRAAAEQPSSPSTSSQSRKGGNGGESESLRTAKAPAADGSITVAAGDTLSEIADKVGTSVAALVATNGLTSANKIDIGQKLLVASPALPAAEPDAGAAANATASEPSSPQPAAGEQVVVKHGDTLTDIAERSRTSVQQLTQLNNLASPDLILTGQKLLISAPVTDVPAGGSSKGTPSDQPAAGATVAPPSGGSSSAPTTEPSSAPSSAPTTEPSSASTVEPSGAPSAEPSAGVPGLPGLGGLVPSSAPTTEPSSASTTEPSSASTVEPSGAPSVEPSAGVPGLPGLPGLGGLVLSSAPTTEPSSASTTEPSSASTVEPSGAPSVEPSAGVPGLPGLPGLGGLGPSSASTVVPSSAPSSAPTTEPSSAPSSAPTVEPSSAPSSAPTVEPSSAPSSAPTTEPSSAPSSAPSAEPSVGVPGLGGLVPSSAPTAEASSAPTAEASSVPARHPSEPPAQREPNASTTSDAMLPVSEVTQTSIISSPGTENGGAAGGLASSLLLVAGTKKLRRSRDTSPSSALRAMVASLTRPVGTWAESSTEQVRLTALSLGGALHAYEGDLDIAVGAIETGESWSRAAAGAYEDRWRASLERLRSLREGRGTTHIRFAHEWNAPWHSWRVDEAELSDFTSAWRLYRSLQCDAFPQARLVFCVARRSEGLKVAWTDASPSDADVDLFGVDYYIAPGEGMDYSPDDFAGGLNELDQYGAPAGLEAHRAYAESRGTPLVISEWSHLSQDGPAAGFAQGLRTYVARHAGTSAGQIAYDLPISW